MAILQIMPDSLIVDKIMRTLTSRIDFIVDSLEESRNVSTMIIEELHSTLEAKELRWIERGAERLVDQAESSKKGGGGQDKRKTIQEEKDKIKERFNASIVRNGDTMVMIAGYAIENK